MEIIGNKLHVDGLALELPDTASVMTLSAWRVPVEYRSDGIFWSLSGSGQPQEVPACSASAIEHLGDMEYEPSAAGQLAAAKLHRMEEFKERCAAEEKELIKHLPEIEVKSWPQQVKEAEQYVTDPLSPMPLLESIAAPRGMSAADLVPKVNQKKLVFAKLSGDIIGRWQAAGDQIEVALTLEEVEAVTW